MLANYVQETANAPGTAATINLGGAAAGRLPFIPTFASGSAVFYGMDDGTLAEMGIGTVTAGSPNTLARTTVLWNSAGTTARMNFLGSVRVYNAVPAERVVALMPDAAAARLTLGVPAAAEFVGQVAYFAANVAPTGWVKANGALLNRSAFPALWAYAQASGALATDAAWLAGASGGFSSGDGSTTFRIPDLRGEFLRAWDDGRGVDGGRGIGTHQGDAIRNITGSLNFGAQMANVQTVTGAFTAPTINQFMPQQATSNTQGLDNIQFNASSAGVPTAAENRPRNLALLACIRF